MKKYLDKRLKVFSAKIFSKKNIFKKHGIGENGAEWGNTTFKYRRFKKLK